MNIIIKIINYYELELSRGKHDFNVMSKQGVSWN